MMEHHMIGDKLVRGERLHGEVFVIRVDKPFVIPEENVAYQALAKSTGCTVLLLPRGRSIESLSEQEMRDAGWVRATEGGPDALA